MPIKYYPSKEDFFFFFLFLAFLIGKINMFRCTKITSEGKNSILKVVKLIPDSELITSLQ